MKSMVLRKGSQTFIIALIVFFTSTAYATEKEKLTSLDDQTSVTVTIYNENLALIKDQRTIRLDDGFNLLAFRGVSAKMKV